MKKIILLSVLLFSAFPLSVFAQTASPSCTISAEKMNVFYIGVDNPVKISAPGVDPGDLSVTISGGNLTGGKGEYIARVTSPGEATISVSQKDGMTTKDLGSMKFRVKRIPDPVAYVGMIKGDGVMTKAEVANIAGLVAKMENFDFDCSFMVTSYLLTVNVSGTWKSYKATSAVATSEMKTALAAARPGDVVIFEGVSVKGPDGSIRKIPGVVITVK